MNRTIPRLGILALSFGLIVSAAQAQSFDAGYAQSYLQKNAKALGLSQTDIKDVIITDQYTTKHNGITHIYVQQRADQIPVFGAQLNLAVSSNGTIVHSASTFYPDVAKAIRSSARALAADDAVRAVATKHGLTVTQPLTAEPVRPGGRAFKAKSPHDVLLTDGGISLQPIGAELVYLPLDNGDIRLAWAVDIYTNDAEHYYLSFVDAASGEVLKEMNLVVQDNWSDAAGTGEQRFLTQLRKEVDSVPMIPYALSTASVASTAVDGASYRVYQAPFESPSHAGDPTVDLRQNIVNPADPTASPLGWHDNGTTSYTVTRGNNVHAYTDLDANNVPDPGSDPDGGAGLAFDFPFDPTQEPSSYRPAAVTNLFYWNNTIHDVMYQYGFDEPAGNFQVNTFGNGGIGSDDVRAEAQDGSGTNNANFGTGVDGVRPRMQMFVWTSPPAVDVNSGVLAGTSYTAGPAAFGAPLNTVGTTGDLAVSDDGAGLSTADGCEPFVGFPAGAIAMADRGNCNFTIKASNAQAAGAIGLIVANNVAGPPITMGGADPTIVIPLAMLSQDDANLFKVSLPLNVTLRKPLADRDSDLDNGVIVHEYGHGISNRLTGGPSTASCLGNAEQMGEGWSDFFAILLTGGGEDGRGIGTYVTFEPTTGGGIRPYPYSTSLSTNPMTYDYIKDSANISQPHGIGSVWATMLNDMTQGLIGRYGYDPNLVSGSGGNNVSLQLVTDGLKLQACQPGFVDGRDGILAADALLGGANQCLIWDSFARRGLGFSASQGSSNDRFDGTESFDVPESCCTFATLTDKINALKAGGTLNGGLTNSLLKKVQNAVAKLNRGGPKAAINMLMAAQKEVADLRAKGILSQAQADELNACLAGLISRIGQDNPGINASMAEQSKLLSFTTVESVPLEFALDASYPNPFSSTTNIRISLPEASQVRLTVYDITGSEIARLVDGQLAAGYHDVTFNGRNLPSGVYFYRVNAGSFVDTKQMILVK